MVSTVTSWEPVPSVALPVGDLIALPGLPSIFQIQIDLTKVSAEADFLLMYAGADSSHCFSRDL